MVVEALLDFFKLKTGFDGVKIFAKPSIPQVSSSFLPDQQNSLYNLHASLNNDQKQEFAKRLLQEVNADNLQTVIQKIMKGCKDNLPEKSEGTFTLQTIYIQLLGNFSSKLKSFYDSIRDFLQNLVNHYDSNTESFVKHKSLINEIREFLKT
jgi:hypothetical protein